MSPMALSCTSLLGYCDIVGKNQRKKYYKLYKETSFFPSHAEEFLFIHLFCNHSAEIRRYIQMYF